MGDIQKRNLLYIAQQMHRFPSELEAVGKHHRRVIIQSRMPLVERLMGWMGIDIIIQDMTPKISASDYEDMLNEVILQNEERKAAADQGGLP